MSADLINAAEMVVVLRRCPIMSDDPKASAG